MKILSLSMLTLFGVTALGQNQVQQNFGPVNPSFCGHNHAKEQWFDYNNDFKSQDSITQLQLQAEYEEFLETWSPDDRVSYVVPIVVHIVHLNGDENISNAQVYEGIEKLNLDFSMTNPDVVNTVASFQGIVGNPDIEFRLATKDPSGNCHSGITRTFSQTTYDTGIDFGNGEHPIVDAVAAIHGVWSQNKYMNLFICIDPNGAAGYTLNPSGFLPGSSMYGGILLRHDYMGTTGTSSNTARHTLSHETGHWLNLSHNWGGSNTPGDAGNCGIDDGVADTPNSIGWTSCNLNGVSCGSLDNVQNIMEYSYCSTMFSQGQVARMHSSLNNSVGGRNNLWTIGNLIATGTDVPSTDICDVDFTATKTLICAGSTIDFSDLSYFGVTNRNWTFSGGSPSTSSDSAVTITYNTPGIYNVGLEISNGVSSLNETSTNYITVLANPGSPLPYTEGFESITFPDNQSFFVENDDNGNTWAITSTAASTGSKSLKLNNYGTSSTKDRFISGPVDLSVLNVSDNFLITFKYAYKKKNVSNDEWLRISVSNDCGETWTIRKNIHGSSLSSDTEVSAYTPTVDSDWKTVTISNVSSSYYVSNFRYKFEFEGDEGNNIYIDDINLYPEEWLATNEVSAENSISIFPNPTNSAAKINYFSTINGDVNITLFNVLGERVKTVYDGEITTGLNEFMIDLQNEAKGIYFIKTFNGKGVITTKLIKE